MTPYRFLRRHGHLSAEQVLNSPEGRRQLAALWKAQARAAARRCDELLELDEAALRRRLRRNVEQNAAATLPVVEELLARSVEAAFRDPVEAARRADLAWELAGCLEVADAILAGGPAALADLRALVQAHRGNARRLMRDFSEARRLFASAEAFLGCGGIRPEAEARARSLHAALLLDTSRPREALEQLARAEALCRRLGDGVELGKVLVRRGNAHRNLGEAKEALAAQEEACRLLREAGNQRLAVAAEHARIVCLGDLGRHREAARALEEAQPLFEACGEAPVRARMEWLRGLIRQGLGEVAAARRSFLNVQRGFLERGEIYDAALVTLDLAALDLEAGAPGRAAAEAAAVHPLLRRHELAHEAGAAFLIFLEAARRGEATAHLAREIAERILALRPWADRLVVP